MNVRKKQKPGDGLGPRRGRSSLLSDPGAKFFCANRGRGTEQEKTEAGLSSTAGGGGGAAGCVAGGGGGPGPGGNHTGRGGEREPRAKEAHNNLPHSPGGGGR